MKPKARDPAQDDLLQPSPTDMRHELVKLAALIDWEFFETEWAGFFPSHTDCPATSPRLVAGLIYPQHTNRLSEEAGVACWVENPYYQHFSAEIFFQHKRHGKGIELWAQSARNVMFSANQLRWM